MRNKKDERGLPAPKDKSDAFTRISKYMTGAAITLTSDEETILRRWEKCDHLLRQNRLTTDELVAHLKDQFFISDWTALGDIRNTQKLFGMARVINKKYVGHLHLERINRDIEAMRDRIFWYEDDDMPGVKKSRVPDAKEMAALAKLHQVYSETLNMLPEQERPEAMPPPKFVFNLVGSAITSTMDLDKALQKADELITGIGEEIDYEQLPPDDDGGDDQ